MRLGKPSKNIDGSDIRVINFEEPGDYLVLTYGKTTWQIHIGHLGTYDDNGAVPVLKVTGGPVLAGGPR